MADWLMEWQTLVGAVIGGIMALVVALVVSRSGRWREFTAAASHVSMEFETYCAALSAMRTTFPQAKLLEGADLEVAMNLVRLRPRLSPLLETSMARILTIDRTLARHLGEVSMASDFAEREFQHAYELWGKGQPPEIFQDRLGNAFECAERAHRAMSRCYTRIGALLNSWFPGRLLLWYRIRRLFGKDELREDKHLQEKWQQAIGKGAADPAIASPDHQP